MSIPLLPVAIFGLAGVSWYTQRRRNRPLDPALKATYDALFDQTMNGKFPPEKLKVMAKAFRERGLLVQANMLDKRVALAEATPEVKEARRQAYKLGMASSNVPGIRNLANAYDAMGAAGAAQKLREYASGLEQAQVDQNVSAGGQEP